MLKFYAPINVKPLVGGGGGGRPGIAGGFDSSHRPIVGNFDRFNGLSSNILLPFSCYFANPLMPWGGAFEQKLSAQFKEQNRYVYLESYTKIVHRLFPNK